MNRRAAHRYRRAAFVALGRVTMIEKKETENRARAAEAARRFEEEIARAKRMGELPGKTVMPAVHGQGHTGAL